MYHDRIILYVPFLSISAFRCTVVVNRNFTFHFNYSTVKRFCKKTIKIHYVNGTVTPHGMEWNRITTCINTGL